ncbi:MAG: SDR family NAD(P)-dependent oxidoreductase [Alphaproteobacteria bacterium]|nr:SDR family NAD(P)-dependent oxidoreductase [Alphaproteobacteria bacterium]
MKNKIALVTGGTSGIGLEIAKQLLATGAKIVVNYAHNEKQADIARTELGDCMFVCADISDESAVKNMFNQIKQKYGKLDYLVNNAGTNTDAFIRDFEAAEFQRVVNVNLVGKFLCTKYAIPLLSNGASIVNISSNLGVRPCAESSAYNAAAAGIINFTKSTTLELAGTGIRVNTVSPGFTPTPLSLSGWTTSEIEQKKLSNPMRRNATTTDIANTVLFLLSDKAAFINGQNILVNGGSVMN